MSKHQYKAAQIHTVPAFQLLNASEEEKSRFNLFHIGQAPKSLSLVCWRAARCFGNKHPPPLPCGTACVVCRVRHICEKLPLLEGEVISDRGSRILYRQDYTPLHPRIYAVSPRARHGGLGRLDKAL